MKTNGEIGHVAPAGSHEWHLLRAPQFGRTSAALALCAFAPASFLSRAHAGAQQGPSFAGAEHPWIDVFCFWRLLSCDHPCCSLGFARSFLHNRPRGHVVSARSSKNLLSHRCGQLPARHRHRGCPCGCMRHGETLAPRMPLSGAPGLEYPPACCFVLHLHSTRRRKSLRQRRPARRTVLPSEHGQLVLP